MKSASHRCAEDFCGHSSNVTNRQRRRQRGRRHLRRGADRHRPRGHDRWSGPGGTRRPAPGGRPLASGAGPAANLGACVAYRPGFASISTLVGADRRRPLRAGRLPRDRGPGRNRRYPARRLRDLVALARGSDIASGGLGRTADQQRGSSRAYAQAGSAGDPLVRRALVGRLWTRSDARGAGAGWQRCARPFALDLGGNRRADDRRRLLLPPAHQGLPARWWVLHRGLQEPRRAPGADRRRRPDDRLCPDRGRVDLRRGCRDHLGHPQPLARHRPDRARGDRDPVGRQPARRTAGRRNLLRTHLRVLARHLRPDRRRAGRCLGARLCSHPGRRSRADRGPSPCC